MRRPPLLSEIPPRRRRRSPRATASASASPSAAGATAARRAAMESLLFDDWRELSPEEHDTTLLASCGGIALLDEDTAASDLRFLDALLPHLADGGGDHAGWAGARGEACSGVAAGMVPANCLHDSSRPTAARAEAEEEEPAHACLDSHHPPGCTRCTPPPCADDAAFYFLRGSKGALSCAPSTHRHRGRVPSLCEGFGKTRSARAQRLASGAETPRERRAHWGTRRAGRPARRRRAAPRPGRVFHPS